MSLPTEAKPSPSPEHADTRRASNKNPAMPAAGNLLAAVDLGSNSFHLVVARIDEDRLHTIDRLKETVRLAAGLDEKQSLNEEAVERALDCLGRFAQRLREMPSGTVRAVGTNTLRMARNGEAFRRKAERRLGHPIEVIAGREEARLIYLGVAHGLAADESRRLVLDIGGGSTELIVGTGVVPIERESVYTGCVSLTRSHFPDSRLDSKRMRAAMMAARVELEPVESEFRRLGWDRVIGSSGTCKAIETISRSEGWCDEGISRQALDKLRRRLAKSGSIDSVQLAGLAEERRPVLPGGVAVLWAVMESLDIEHLSVSDMALRDGVLYDLLGRARDQDVRDVSVSNLCDLYRVDELQTERIRRTALMFLDQVANSWELELRRSARMLEWAANLHEIGLAIAHNQYHKHGAYLIHHGDMPGFSRQEQSILATLVRGHRRKFPAAAFDALPDPVFAKRLCVLLRLSVALHRSRSPRRLPELHLSAGRDSCALAFPDGWLDRHPLTRADLDQESKYLKSAGFTLGFA